MSEFQTPSNQIKEFLEKDNFQDLEQYINQADLSLEPFLIDSLPEILYKLTNNKTSEEAKKIGELIIQKMNPFSMKLYMEVLYENMKSMKWQVKKGALVLLGLFAKHQQEIVKFNLPNMILRLIDMASDVKKDVQEQTRVCFNELCGVIDNVDIIKALQSGSISSFDAGQIAAAANSSLQEVADTIRAATSAGVSVDLEATAQGLGYSSFADAVSAYNEQHGTNYTVDEAKESLGQ